MTVAYRPSSFTRPQPWMGLDHTSRMAIKDGQQRSNEAQQNAAKLQSKSGALAIEATAWYSCYDA